MAFIDLMKEKARQNRKTIVLPESEDQRTLTAAAQILKEGTAVTQKPLKKMQQR